MCRVDVRIVRWCVKHEGPTGQSCEAGEPRLSCSSNEAYKIQKAVTCAVHASHSYVIAVTPWEDWMCQL